MNLVHVVVLPRAELGLQCEIGHAENRVHRRADLVAHVGEEHRLGTGCVFRLLARRFEFVLHGMPPGDVVFDGLRHRIERAAQCVQFVDTVNGTGARHIVPCLESIGFVAEPMNWDEYLPSNDAQGQRDHDDGHSHTDQRQQDPALEPALRGSDIRIGAMVSQPHQYVDRR